MLDLTVADIRSAWDHVLANAGCAGVDGVTVEHFCARADSSLPELLAGLERGSYRPLPLREMRVEKKPGSSESRQLLIPCVLDRIAQTAFARKLSQSWEEEFLEGSFAYRPGRGVDRAVARIRQWRDRGFRWLLDADIASYFASVNHKHLLELLAARVTEAAALDVIRRWVRISAWDGARLAELRRGIPQGSPISPLFANLYLSPFDRGIEESGNHLVRYSDDFIVLCPTREAAEEARRQTGLLLQAAGLELKEEKTRVTSFAEGFNFLGVTFREDDIWVRWKDEAPRKRVLFLARPMPGKLLRQYRADQAPPPDSPEPGHRTPATLPTSVTHPQEDDVAYLYLTEPGSVLRKSGDRLLVEKEDRVLLDLPYHKLEAVLLFGNVQVTAQAMAELLDKGVRLSVYTRYGRYRGSLAPPQGRNIERRLHQFELFRDGARSLEAARAVVRAKLANGLSTLARWEERQAVDAESQARRQTIRDCALRTGEADSLAALEGLEGAAAQAYFTELMRFNRSGFEWPGRIKHPATDPLNALLSLAYTLLAGEILGMLEAAAIDPYLGFYHQPDYGRPSLAMDLLEPFRHPVADRFVLVQVNRGGFAPAAFEKPEGDQSVHLRPEPLKDFFERYEAWMLAGRQAEGTNFRQLLQQEVERFAASLDRTEPWRPFAADPDALAAHEPSPAN